MALSQLQSFLGWCAVLNYGVLILACLAWAVAGDAFHRQHAHGFHLDRARCDFAVYLMLGLYKLAILFACVVPWLALHLPSR